MKIGQYFQRQRCRHVELEQFWQAFASRGFVSDSWAFLLFLAMCADHSWPRSTFESTINSSAVSYCIVCSLFPVRCTRLVHWKNCIENLVWIFLNFFMRISLFMPCLSWQDWVKINNRFVVCRCFADNTRYYSSACMTVWKTNATLLRPQSTLDTIQLCWNE